MQHYLPALVFAGIGAGIGIVFALANTVLGPRPRRRDTDPYESGIADRARGQQRGDPQERGPGGGVQLRVDVGEPEHPVDPERDEEQADDDQRVGDPREPVHRGLSVRLPVLGVARRREGGNEGEQRRRR